MLKNTVFRQVIQIVPRYDFEKAQKAHFEGRRRRMTPWNQFLAMFFAQLCGCDSLRHIESVLASHSEKNYHHGMRPVKRSTLARVNDQFSYKIYAEFARLLLQRCAKVAPTHTFSFKNELISLDSTVISLCKDLFDWAQFRQSKGGVKIHTQLNHSGHLPSVLCITPAKSSDSRQARLLKAKKGDMVVFDRGYFCFKWFKSLDDKGVFFVTRLKSNVGYEVLKSRTVPKQNDVASDQTIRFTGPASGEFSGQLRLVTYFDRQNTKTYHFLTNNFKLAASTIAAIYKERWRIETFFKELKQNLKVKTFVGTSENAVKTQIYIAICTYLLLKLLLFSHGIKLALSQVRRIIAAVLFSSKPLVELLKPGLNSTPDDRNQIAMILL